MKRIQVSIRIIALILFAGTIGSVYAEAADGPLRVCASNPRYFTDDSGKAILLTGSHHWYNLTDMGPGDPPPPLDYTAYLDWMKNYNHNFMRMWAWEMVTWDTQDINSKWRNENTFHHVGPLPWARTGPGNALDGKPKFDLTKYDTDYFSRLRSRIVEAGERGIYVSVMLFEGWSMQHVKGGWKRHPFHPDNNINGIDGDQNGDGKGLEVHELAVPAVTAIQENYVRHVIDTVNGFDNVLYEISNENHPPSSDWQYHIIEFIHQYERTKPKQHPVGMTFQFKGGSNKTLFDSPAEWVSPNHEGGYRDNPPAANGTKVILTDTDHLWGIGGNQAWVWKSLCRGMNPIFMDPYDGIVLGEKFDPRWEPIRKSMGYALRIADRIDITTMKPLNELASSHYCLAEPGKKYIVYLPEGKPVTVDLSGSKTHYAVRWFNPNDNSRQRADDIQGGAKQKFTSPFGNNDAVLVLFSRAR